MNQLSFKPGQSKQMEIAESIINKIKTNAPIEKTEAASKEEK